MRNGMRVVMGAVVVMVAVGVWAQRPTTRPTSRPAAEKTAPVESKGETPPELELARAVIAAHGGEDALRDAGTIAFDFVIESGGQERMRRHHVWSPATGEYVVTFMLRDGGNYEVHFDDVETSETARVAKDGAPLEDAAKAAELAEAAQGMFINDTYWMFAPLKLLDPGVALRLEPDEEFEGAPVRVLHLSFEEVGMTPGDQYWMLIDPATHMVRGWRFKLEGDREGAFRWTGKETVAGITAESRREAMDGGMAIVLGGFTSGEALMPARGE